MPLKTPTLQDVFASGEPERVRAYCQTHTTKNYLSAFNSTFQTWDNSYGYWTGPACADIGNIWIKPQR